MSIDKTLSYNRMNKYQVKVAELFGGVGGFRVGLNKIKKINKNGRASENGNFHFVYFNQWEPKSKVQFAFECYKKRFDDKTCILSNEDIEKVNKKTIPYHDLLVAGFPCQDYSVARVLSGEKGIHGKKGVLWWQIYKTIKEKNTKFVLLENVDRLLISPSKQKGRDFSIMLKCFHDLGYTVEWKVINAAEYGMPQKRRRIFIFAFKNNTRYFIDNIKNIINNEDKIYDYIVNNNSLLTSNFKNYEFNNNNLQKHAVQELNLDIEKISRDYTAVFFNTGIMIDGKIYTCKQKANIKNKIKPLKDILLPEHEVNNSCYIKDNDVIKKLIYMKDSKSIIRNKNGYIYKYTEGKMSFPESLDLPGRTMLTSEGTVNRSSHIIGSKKGFRFLDPKECELLNMFPQNWTKIDGISDRKRRFLMGNSLVCGILERLSNDLYKIIKGEKS